MMEENQEVEESISDIHKYRRVIPIIGLLFFYLGGLIVSLDVANNLVFLLQLWIFSVILVVSLQWPVNKAAVILGALIEIFGSLGPVVNLFLSIQNGVLGFSVLGGSLILFSIILQFGTIFIWMKEPGKFIL
jgi:membrane associated rhomboid family serine protease